MAAKPLLENAVIAVQDKAMTGKFHFGTSQPTPKAQQAAETFLRVWGDFSSEQHVYFMAGVDHGTYLLSLVSDPAHWTEAEFPKFRLKRLTPGTAAFDAFELSFDSESAASSHHEKLRLALEQFVSVERGQDGIRSSVSQQGSSLRVTITK